VAFLDEYNKAFGVEPIRRVLTEHGCKIAPSTHYAARTRPPSARALRDAELTIQIERIYRDRKLGRGLYGARKVWLQLLREGFVVGRCTVERPMRQAGLRGVRRGKQFVTTRRDKAMARPPDPVKRHFHAEHPNALWVVEFTYVPTWSGMAFTAFVSDVFSRRILGWRCSDRMPTELPLDALERALWIRARTGESVHGLIHHSDAGSRYAAIRYPQRLLDVGAVASIGTVGDGFDNALAESVVGLYKAECVWHDGPWHEMRHLELGTCDWVSWFNTSRLHGALGGVPPIEYEAAYHAKAQQGVA
jgi:putative transposase